MKHPVFKPYGKHAILLEWEQMISPKVHKQVLFFQNYISEKFSDELIEIVPAYNSLAVYLEATVNPETIILHLKEVKIMASEIVNGERFLVDIPVCYDAKFGLDINEIAVNKNISTSEVIKRHTVPTYPVYFIGFLPGFPYLGGLDERLYCERKAQPRSHVLAGSVAIGGKQTGIYPSNSPGGWHIIGRTPLEIFNINKNHIGLLNAGDRVRFFEISEEEFNVISFQVEEGTYKVIKEVIHD